MDDSLSKKFNVLSLWSILLVLYLHSNSIFSLPEESWIFKFQLFWASGICKSAVPLFFIISGYLFGYKLNGELLDFKKYKALIFGKLRTLGIPFIVWVSGSILFFLLVGYIVPEMLASSILVVESFSDILYYLFIAPPAYQLWFIRDLFILFVFSPLLVFYVSKGRLTGLFLLVALWLWLDFIWIVQTESILFFAFGLFLASHKQLIKHKQGLLIVIGSTVLWILLSYARVFDILNSWHVKELSIMFGLYSIWNLYDLLSDAYVDKYFVKISRYTFFIYAFHEPLLTIQKKSFSLLFTNLPLPYSLEHFLIFIVTPLSTFLIAFLVAKILESKLLYLYTVLVGGRIK